MNFNTILIIAGGLIGVMILLGILVSIFGKKPDQSWKKDIANRIDYISRNTDPSNSQSLKLAIFEYDKLLDQTLIKLRVGGTTLGERLKKSNHLFRDKNHYNKVWNIHKLRNQLAHSMDFNPSTHELTSATGQFREVINYLIR